jgi:hypothetical protein
MHERLAVYVPDPDAPAEAARTVAHIDRGSGIVGTPVQPDDPESPVLLHYEGNRFNYANVHTFADRVMIAAGRHRENAPTIATCLARPDALIQVGWYHQDEGRVEIAADDDPAGVPAGRRLYRLADWIGKPLDNDRASMASHAVTLAEELRETPRPMSVKEATIRAAIEGRQP